MSSGRSVCIIGAGAAGLCALRHFTARPTEFSPIVCYEQTGAIGGTWNYTEELSSTDDGIPLHSAMYRDLRTLAPVQIMGYPDFPFQSIRSYLHHNEVRKYIQSYADQFTLTQFIKFRQHLTHLSREEDRWKITVKDLTTTEISTHLYDIIVLCPGRFWIPYWPNIPTLSEFTGNSIHSHDYRYREPYQNQKVAVVGASASGADIAMELSTVAQEVILINRTANQFHNLPPNVHQLKAEIDGFTSDSIALGLIESDETLTFSLDSVIFATGFRLNLSFLDQEACGLKLNANDTLDGMYRHFINIEHPTMAILSLIEPSISLPLYHQQILYFIKLLTNEISQPSKQEMIDDTEADIVKRKARGVPDFDRHLFKLDDMAGYFVELETAGHLEPVPPVIWSVIKEMEKRRSEDLIKFRDCNYRIVDSERFEEIF